MLYIQTVNNSHCCRTKTDALRINIILYGCQFMYISIIIIIIIIIQEKINVAFSPK